MRIRPEGKYPYCITGNNKKSTKIGHKMITDRCYQKLCILLTAFFLFFTGFSANSMEQPNLLVTINYIETTSDPVHFANRVCAYVTVSSSDRESLSGLTLSNFVAMEDGSKIDIQEVSQTDDPMSVVLAIDTSGSMLALDRSGRTSIEAARDAAVEFISMLGDNDRVALFSFDNNTNFHLDFSTDHQTSIKAVKGLSAREMAPTCLYDTVMAAIKKASEIPKGRRAIILLTDGKDEKGDGRCSIHSFNDVIDAATTKTIRVPIYTIGLGPQVDVRELGRLASLTGGRNMIAESISELSSFYRSIGNQLKNQYRVEYLTRSTSGEHSLVIKVTRGADIGQDERRFWSPPVPVSGPPDVSIIQPRSGDSIGNIVDVQIKLSSEEGISKVRFYVDGVLKQEDASSPFEGLRWDTSDLAEGMHVLRVEAVHVNGQIGYEEATLKREGVIPETEGAPLLGRLGGKKAVLFGTAVFIILLLIIFVGFRMWSLTKRPIKETGSSLQTKKIPATGGTQPGRTVPQQRDKTQEDSDIDKEATTIDAQFIKEPLAKLTVIKSHELDLGATFKVLRSTELGRGSGNDIRIPDKSVSRKHAVINYIDGNFYIRDLNSTYGTKVNGKDVTSRGVMIDDESQIEVGTSAVLKFNILMKGKETKKDDETIVYDQDS
jgi:VWFA-related protein